MCMKITGKIVNKQYPRKRCNNIFEYTYPLSLGKIQTNMTKYTQYSSMLAIVFVSRQILYKKTRVPWTATPSLIKLNEKGLN